MYSHLKYAYSTITVHCNENITIQSHSNNYQKLKVCSMETMYNWGIPYCATYSAYPNPYTERTVLKADEISRNEYRSL